MISQMNQGTAASHVDSASDATNLARANAILAELKEAGYSDKDLNQIELIVLMEMAANEQAARTHSNSL